MPIELKPYETPEFTKKVDRVNLSDFMVLYRNWCKSCGICVEFCPVHCLAFDEDQKPYLNPASACIQCKMCDLRCPDLALVVAGKDKKTK